MSSAKHRALFAPFSLVLLAGPLLLAGCGSAGDSAANTGGAGGDAGLGSGVTGGSGGSYAGSLGAGGSSSGANGLAGAAHGAGSGGAPATGGAGASGGAVGMGGGAAGAVGSIGGSTGAGGSKGGSGGTGPTGGASGHAGSAGTAGNAGGAAGAAGAAGGGGGVSEQPIGWASVNASGQNGTTGGQGGPTSTVTTCAALKSALSQSGSAIVKLSGKITCDDIALSSNKSLIGLPGAGIVATSGTSNHVLVAKDVSNIIVRNLVLQGAGITDGNKSAGDVFHIETNVHHLWADHLDISDGDDGNLDITHSCDYITVSWTKFHYTSGSRVHRFSDLISSAVGDTGTYKITWHHNWWAANVDQRSPRAHEGSGGIHVFNNYYSEAGNSYCIGAGQNAVFLSENNYFDGVSTPFEMSPNSETGGQLLSKGDVFHNTSGNQTGTSKGFTPPYSYTLDAAASVPALVQAGAGATL